MDNEAQLAEIYFALPYGVDEHLLARPLGENLYEVESIPFWIPDLHYHDIVFALSDETGKPPRVHKKMQSSGHRTLHIDFVTSDQIQKQGILNKISEMKAHYAHIDGDDEYYVIDAVSKEHYRDIHSYVKTQEKEGGIKCLD